MVVPLEAAIHRALVWNAAPRRRWALELEEAEGGMCGRLPKKSGKFKRISGPKGLHGTGIYLPTCGLNMLKFMVHVGKR